MKALETPRDSTARDPTGAGGRPLLVVGIGASAGGLKALQQFVEAVPVRAAWRSW
jgi:chemotaxis response regulator CheB